MLWVWQRDDLASLKAPCYTPLLATPSAPHNAPLPLHLTNPAENWQKLAFNSTEQLFCRRVLAGGPVQLTSLLGQGGEGPAVAAGQEVSARARCCRHLVFPPPAPPTIYKLSMVTCMPACTFCAARLSDPHNLLTCLPLQLGYTGLILKDSAGAEWGVVYSNASGSGALWRYPAQQLSFCAATHPGEMRMRLTCGLRIVRTARAEWRSQSTALFGREAVQPQLPSVPHFLFLRSHPPAGCSAAGDTGRAEEGASCRDTAECCGGLQCTPRGE